MSAPRTMPGTLLVLNNIYQMISSLALNFLRARTFPVISQACSVDIGLSASTKASISLFILNLIFVLSLGPRHVQ